MNEINENNKKTRYKLNERINMRPDKMVLVPSRSRYELELSRCGGEAKAKERFVEPVWNYIRTSHFNQETNKAKIFETAGYKRRIDRSALTQDLIEQNYLFVILGGDNHFTYCAQEILKYMQDNPSEKKYVAGVVLDPKSAGALLYFNADSFLKNLSNLETGNCAVEEWTTLEAKINEGQKSVTSPYPATCEYLIAESGRADMTRNNIYFTDKTGAKIEEKTAFPEKSSGILVATGSGSLDGSWYDNIHGVAFKKPDTFSKEAPFARVINTENKEVCKETLCPGETLHIFSYNDAGGIITPDAHKNNRLAEFPMGYSAEIQIGKNPLPVTRIV